MSEQFSEHCPDSKDGTHCDCWWDGAACCHCHVPADPDVCPDCGASDAEGQEKQP